VAGRVLAFADPEIIRMAREDFIPVVGDDWYQRRRQDAEGRFFRKVSDLAGRGSYDESGGVTRQAIYCLTASGKLLAWKNAGQLPAVMRKTLRQGLAAWRKLPESERRAGAVHVEPLKPDPRFDRSPPSNGLILDVYTRALNRNSKGELERADQRMNGVRIGAQHDHMWLTEAEWKALVPANPQLGDAVAVPATVARRIFQYHLVDSTLGEPTLWEPQQICSGQLNLTVGAVTNEHLRLRLQGAALMSTHPDPNRADRGYDVRLVGHLDYDRAKGVFERFDILALGDAWGKNPIYGKGPQKPSPLGVVFELALGNTPADRVPPQGIRDLGAYLPRPR
jgi:hypothetical protein